MTRLAILSRHPSVVVMAAAFGAAILFLWISGAPVWVWALVPLGVPAQMLNEYNLHRHVFHLAPPKRQWAFDLLYQAHYGHHDFPTNVGLFFVPIWVAVPILIVNFSLTALVVSLFAPSAALWVASAVIAVGGIGTFLAYEWFHMTAHLPVAKTRIEARVTRLHNQHHFRDFSRWFHVTPGGEVIDRAMGTAIDRDSLRTQQRAEFMTTLGLKPNDPRLICARERFAGKYDLSPEDCARAARQT